MSGYRRGERVQNRRGRVGVVVRDMGEMHVLIRYEDGTKSTWVDRVNLAPESEGSADLSFRCPDCGWATRNREVEQHICAGPNDREQER